MAAPDSAEIFRVGGRLCIDPTDLTAAWPHGGTGLGAPTAVHLDTQFQFEALPQEERGSPFDVQYQGESWLVSAVLRQWNDDVLGTIFPNTSTGASSSTNVVNARGSTIRAGGILSGRAVKLCFTPYDQTNHPGFLLPRAIPVIADEPFRFSVRRELRFRTLWVAIEGANGRVGDVGLVADLDSLL